MSSDPDTSKNANIAFTFTDENGTNINSDLEFSLGTTTGINQASIISLPSTVSIPLNNNANSSLPNSNVWYNDSNNRWQVLYFNRKTFDSNASTELSYQYININYTINNDSGNTSNTANLSGLLGTIDYSKVGLVSANMSQVFLGNWKIMPSGDGQSLLFRYSNAGTNPYTQRFSMDELYTKWDSTSYNNNTLHHISVPKDQQNPQPPQP